MTRLETVQTKVVLLESGDHFVMKHDLELFIVSYYHIDYQLYTFTGMAEKMQKTPHYLLCTFLFAIDLDQFSANSSLLLFFFLWEVNFILLCISMYRE